MIGFLKKIYHKFIVDENGAVSIYAIIITLLLFIFNAVLIDFIRIMAAERETDTAMKTAIRSTMSAYNQDVKGYGLFGFEGGESEAKEIFDKVLRENLKQEEGDYFSFIDTKLEDDVNIIVSDRRMLSNKTTFEYQVLEEMKYSAPMEIGKTIIEGFLQVSKAMQEASTYVEIATSIQDDVEDREEKLDKIKSKLEIAQQRSTELGKVVHSESTKKFPTVANLQDLLKHLKKYQEIKERDPLSEPGEDEKEEEKKEREEEEEKREQDDKDIITFERQAKELMDTFKVKSYGMRGELEDALTLIEEAKELNEKIKKTIDDKRAEANESYGNANQAADMNQNETGNADGTISEIREANRKLDDYIIDPEFFTNLENKTSLAKAEVDLNNDSNLEGQISLLQSIIDAGDFYRDSDKNRIASFAGQIKNHQDTANTLIDEAYEIITGDRPPIKDEGVEEKEEEAEEELESANEDLDKLLNEAEAMLGDQELIKQIADLAAKYEGSIEDSKNEFNRENPDDVAKDSMNFVDMVFSAIGDALINSRDKLYMNEFIMTKFKAHDFKVKGAEGFSLPNNEVEYIMYGLESTGANYAAALTEIFAFRFAVNFVESFTDAKVRAFGPYMWAAALVYALTHTIADMSKISSGEKPRFFKSIRYKAGYHDYLKIFLFMHPEGNKIARTMALIENNSDADLTTLPTYISAEASTSVKLWFLPGVANMLGQAGVISGRVENNRYFIDKKIDYSY
ncbi:DUF5702 domain-containing protein [Lederbergia sp. NSJ-179]|uniref:DUF5702 domain-containing protein n=1 Tax=Lederbergia sp. NSJ-179 TaxID=2931402 RepID=UPI001FCFE27A|nr:DUF5702 domain-containing protein [Lederbergia sp. NSJ-179]MCJ7840230.1 DUF5702 domain-containing protein [Lederbergia sp. NSJ-179]